MPNRLICLAILVFWAAAAGALLTRDVLPTLIVGTPPDLRSVTRASRRPGPTDWAILMAPEGQRDPTGSNVVAVGHAVTDWTRKRDGYVAMESHAWIDANALIGTQALADARSGRIAIDGIYEVDPLGNLDAFTFTLRDDGGPKGESLGTIEGRVRNNELYVTAQSSQFRLLRWGDHFPYEPREMVQNALGPIDYMPGLQVGMAWESQVVSPLTGRVTRARVEVVGKRVIQWGNNPVIALEVLSRMPPLSARSWVRPDDGLVIRQEVPMPMGGTMILERQQPEPSATGPADGRRDGR